MEKFEGVLLQDGTVAVPAVGKPAAGPRVRGVRAGSIRLLETQAAVPARFQVAVHPDEFVVGWTYQGITRLRPHGSAIVAVEAGKPFYASSGRNGGTSIISWDGAMSGMLFTLPYADVFGSEPGPAIACGAVARVSSLMEPAKAFLAASFVPQGMSDAEASYALERLTVEMLVAIFLEVGAYAGRPEGVEPSLLDKALVVIRSKAKDPGLDPTLLAAILGTSLRSLHREFRGHNHSVAATIRMQRVANARGMLEHPGQAALPLDRLAAKAGFSSVVTMTRAFLASGLETPAKCRRSVLKQRQIRKLSYA